MADKAVRRLNELTTNVFVAAQAMTARKMALNGDILFTASRKYGRYDIVKAEGLRKDQCSSAPEARQLAARMSCEHTTRPTHPFHPSVGKSA